MCQRYSIQATCFRDVFMVSMAFVVPLHRVRKEFKRRITIPLTNEQPFVHNFTADFRICSLSRLNPQALTYVLFHFVSANRDERTIRVYPYLIRNRIGNHLPYNYAIVLLAEIDKVFNHNFTPISDDSNLCNPEDIVFLKKAFYKSCNSCLYTVFPRRMSIQDWLMNLVAEVSGKFGNYWRHPSIAGSVVNIRLDFKPQNRLRYLFNKIRNDAQEARQLEYMDIFDGVLDFEYQLLVVDAIHKNKLNQTLKLNEKVKRHF